MFKDIKDHLEKNLKNTQYAKYLSKLWVYREKCLVLDFEYKGIRFAFDIEIDEVGKVQLSMVDRNSHLNFYINKTTANKVKIYKNLSIDSLDLKIISVMDMIFKTIDNEFKYKISVIVPVYNREKLILKCIDSLNNQTLGKDLFEVIFVDDCSTDNTISTINEKCDPALNYIILERPVGSGSASAPRNDGINKSKGKYVFFLDSDDYLTEDCLNNVLNYAEKNASQITYVKMGTPADQSRNIPVRVFKKGSIEKATIWDNQLLRSNYIFRLFDRSFLKLNKILFDVSLNVNEDKLFNIQVLSKAKNVSILADKEYLFLVRHDGEHLGRSVADLKNEYFLYVKGYSYIFSSDNDEIIKNELFNGWTNIVIERFISIFKSKRYKINEKKSFFKNVLMLIDYENYTINENQIYGNLKPYIPAINEENFDLFMKILEVESE